jgi:N-methylhydantoinase B
MTDELDPVRITIFDNAFASVCEEMGETLRRCAVSVNVKDRLDFSAALFDPAGHLVAQAAHIPVHLGSMASALRMILAHVQPGPGEMVLTNDPYRGGTHLPDLTLIAPVHHGGRLIGYVANRAHHADVGGRAGASMAPAERLEDEGVVIPPTVVFRAGQLLEPALKPLFDAVALPEERRRDLMAQVAGNQVGQRRLAALEDRFGAGRLAAMMGALMDYSERAMRALVAELPAGRFAFADHLDDDGLGGAAVRIRVAIERRGEDALIDFSGTAPCVRGNVNAVLPVTAASVFYVFRCLLGEDVPSNAGCLRPLAIRAPEGTVVNATFPHAVAAGNVETSQRIVDVLLGALAQAWPERVPAASCGSMNNVSLASPRFAYYETIAGGMGAGPRGAGLSAVHTHMTNTRNTPVEMMEEAYPVRVVRYCVRDGSGGEGARAGGDGVVREIEALEPMTAAILTERRRRAPWGLAGGRPGRRGRDRVRSGGAWRAVPGKAVLKLEPGDRLRIETPGGGGHGKAEK